MRRKIASRICMALAFIIMGVSSESCTTSIRKNVGLVSPEDAILADDQYRTPKAKTLAVTYRPQLLRLAEHIYGCRPLRLVKNGIGFRQPKGAETDDRYLSVWVTIDQTDGSFASMPREQRVSAMFSRYGLDLLRRMTAMAGAASDTNVMGFSVVLGWAKPGMPPNKPATETLALFVDKLSLIDFLGKRLSPTEFVGRAKFLVFDGKEPIIPVKLEIWQETFNSTCNVKSDGKQEKQGV